MFVVDDILLTYFVLPYANRLLDQGRNKLYDWLDEQGVKLWGRGLRSRRNLLKALGHYVEKHPGTAAPLAAEVLFTELPTILDSVDNFLTRIFKMVQELGHPAVLPGFLTGTDYLTVIDVRTPPGTQLEMPSLPSLTGSNDPEIRLWSPLPPAGVAPRWMPRLWLVSKTEGELARDPDTALGQLAAALKEFASKPDTTPGQLAAKLEDQLFVTGVTSHDVVVRHAQMPLENLTPVTSGESRRIAWAESPDGVKDMLEALTRQLGERKKHEELWRRALTGKNGFDPSD